MRFECPGCWRVVELDESDRPGDMRAGRPKLPGLESAVKCSGCGVAIVVARDYATPLWLKLKEPSQIRAASAGVVKTDEVERDKTIVGHVVPLGRPDDIAPDPMPVIANIREQMKAGQAERSAPGILALPGAKVLGGPNWRGGPPV
jgi:hypothetical protein